MFDPDTIKTNLEAIFPDRSYSHRTIRVQKSYRNPSHLIVEVVQMYEKPELEDTESTDLLAFLTKVRDACGAQYIDLGSDIHHSGCKTCDYGSGYGWVFTVRDW